MNRLLPLTAAVALVAGACAVRRADSAPARSAAGSESTPHGASAAPSRAADSLPPPSGITPDAPFPRIEHRELPNGLALRVIERHVLPIVELRLVTLSGQATDAGKPGLAVLTGDLLKDGGAGAWSSRQLVEQVESLGADLSIRTDRDSTRISMAVTTRDFERALELVGTVAQRPRFDPGEFAKLKNREIERVTNLARVSGGWGASMVLYRELYELPTSLHPYSHYDALPSELRRLTLADSRHWHARHFTPKNSFLVVVGDVTPDQVAAAAERVFGSWKGEAPPRPAFSPPLPPRNTRLFVVDRQGSAQSQIYVATLGPEVETETWAALKVTNQILGGGFAGRLFLDVREKRSLAYSTGSSVEELAQGPVPIALSAGTQTAKTAHAVQALLEHFRRIGSTPPSEDEVEIASRYLSDSFLISTSTVPAIADLSARLGVFGLPDDWYDDYRRDVRSVAPGTVVKTAGRYYQPGRALVVISGDAARIAEPLRRFGEVTVVDPERDFVVEKKLAHDPTAPLGPPEKNP